MTDIKRKRKILKGIVTSDKMQKTVIVEVERKYRHPVYKKVLRAQKRYKVDNPNNTAKIDDLVEIMETKPISRDKRWRVSKIIQKSKGAGFAEQAEKEEKNK